MVVKLKEPEKKLTAGDGINISDNNVISVLLRAANNLIHVNEDRELYVDLQLEDGIEPTDDFPVGVTTGRILAEDGWEQSGTMLNIKTTSGDYFRLIMGNDGNLYLDPGTGVWTLIGNATGETINVKKFNVANSSDAVAGQAVIDWFLDGKYPIVRYGNSTYILENQTASNQIRFNNIHTTVYNLMNQGYSYTGVDKLYLNWDANNLFTGWNTDTVTISPCVLDVNLDYQTPYTPTYNGSPATKKYVDDGLATKQDTLIAGSNISIAADGKTISANLSAMNYKGSVADQASLPASGNTIGDVYVTQDTGVAYCWNGTSWDSLGSFVDLSDYFNITQNTSDDITEGSNKKFVSQTEKNRWNGKQDALTAGDGITIDQNNEISADPYTAGDGIAISAAKVISNTKTFEPENQGTLAQVLKKTSTGYAWANESGGGTVSGVTSVNGRTGAVTVDEFTPSNSGSTGQVIKKTASGYEWANESGGGGGGTSYSAGTGINIDANNVISNSLPFNPGNAGNAGEVLYKSASGYNWGPNLPIVITDETNLWTLAPGVYVIGLNAQTQTAAPIKLNCKSTGVEEVGYFYAWYGSILTIAENYQSGQNLGLYYNMTSGRWIHYGYADSSNGTYRKIFLHQNDPITLTCASYLDVDLNESLNYTLLLDQNCSLTFGQQTGHATFTPGCVYQFLIIQDSTGGHTLTLPNNFIYAGGNNIFPTTAGSICKLIVDYQDGNYFASITQYT